MSETYHNYLIFIHIASKLPQLFQDKPHKRKKTPKEMENIHELEESVRNFVETMGDFVQLTDAMNEKSNEVVEATYRELLEIRSTTNSNQERIILPAESSSSPSELLESSSSKSFITEDFHDSESGLYPKRKRRV